VPGQQNGVSADRENPSEYNGAIRYPKTIIRALRCEKVITPKEVKRVLKCIESSM
jgi:hypothetical protein